MSIICFDAMFLCYYNSVVILSSPRSIPSDTSPFIPEAIVRFQVVTAVSTKFRVFWDVLQCSQIDVDRCFRSACFLHYQGDECIALMMEAARTSETSVDNYFTRKYTPEDKSELHTLRSENFKSHKRRLVVMIVNNVFKDHVT
jgi:hypothetical protein